LSKSLPACQAFSKSQDPFLWRRTVFFLLPNDQRQQGVPFGWLLFKGTTKSLKIKLLTNYFIVGYFVLYFHMLFWYCGRNYTFCYFKTVFVADSAFLNQFGFCCLVFRSCTNEYCLRKLCLSKNINSTLIRHRCVLFRWFSEANKLNNETKIMLNIASKFVQNDYLTTNCLLQPHKWWKKSTTDKIR